MRKRLLIGLLIIASPIIAQVKPAQRVDSSQDREALMRLTDEIVRAKSKRDIDALERIFGDDYVFTNPAGLLAHKAEYIDGARADTATYESVMNSERVVNLYGDAAVVSGVTTVKGSYDGHDIGGRFRFTSTFVKRKDGWKCVATQLTRIMV
jgi:ketosteroid isomerase-like protein